MAKFTKNTESNIYGNHSYYTAVVNGVEVGVWMQEYDYGRGRWQFGLTYGPVKMINRRRTLKEAQNAAVELAKNSA